jgi:hypothetical protein
VDAWASAKAGRQTAAIGVVATDGRAPIVSKDIDGDISVKLIDLNPNHAGQHTAEKGVAAPYEAATQGRDYWLSPGVPHCADCHEAPFVEGQGGAASRSISLESTPRCATRKGMQGWRAKRATNRFTACTRQIQPWTRPLIIRPNN